MAVSYVQRAQGVNLGYVNISPTANNLICVTSTTSAGGGNPTATFAFFSGAGGTGTNLGSLTVPAAMATANDTSFWVTGAYGKVPAGTASILGAFAGGLPGECYMEAVELTGQDGTSPFLAGGMNQQNSPGTAANAITSGLISVASAAYILGVCNDSTGDADMAAGTGFTARGAATNNFAVEDQTQASSGSFAATFTAATHGATDYYHTFLFAIQAAAGAAFAGTPADATSASGRLNSDFLAALTDATSASAFLGPFPEAHAKSVTTLTGALGTAQAVAAAATDTTAGAGTLTNWASVVLAAPLYSGVGSVLDANGSWSNGAPGAGATVFYDGTNMTILPNGEIVTSSQNFSAVCQWKNGSTWSFLTVIVTPGLAGYPASTTSLVGLLAGAVLLGSAATDLSTATGAISTQIPLGGAPQDLASATADLATAIQAAAAAIDTASASGTLSGTSNLLTGAATDDDAVTGFINTQITVISAAVDVTQAAGALATQVRLACNAVSISSAFGQLQTGVPVAGAAMAVSSASAILSSGINLAGAATSVSSAAAQLLTEIQAVAAATDSTVLAGSLKTGVLFSSAASTVANAIASLSTLIRLAGNAQSASSASGALSTQGNPNITGAASDTTTAGGALSTHTVLAGGPADSSAATGALSVGAKLASDAQDESTAAADLLTFLDPDANAISETTLTGELGAAGSDYIHPDVMFVAPPEGFWPADGLLPWGLRVQHVGDMLLYAIDWSEWLANRWLPRAKVVPGDKIRPTRGAAIQLTCATGGYTGTREPRWPTNVGAQVLDGTAAWQVQALDQNSLADTIAEATWSASAPALGISNVRTLNAVETLATIDTTQAIAGTDYDVSCQIVTQSGRQKAGKFRIKAR